MQTPNPQMQVDARVPPLGVKAVVRFYCKRSDKPNSRWLDYGPQLQLHAHTPLVNSMINPGPNNLAVQGRIFWGRDEIFRTETLTLKPGDSFTFNFGKGVNSQ